ncbi:MAG: DNA-directed RNA polymerase subunit alpha [Dehalococcoidia bacterium]|nr:DNA-directed RNA polymerase subunit alpha [Dehalococcoidia bacterium]
MSNVSCVEIAGNYGRFLAEPLEAGSGITLGNTLRRVLLSSLIGAAVTWVKIEGVQHEFTPIPDVKEDALEFLLNVKELRLCPLSHEPGKLMLEAEGEGSVCAGDIKPTTDFRVANPELYLATLDSSQAKLNVEFNVELGKGYVPAKATDDLPVGALPVDAIFTPVLKTNFSIEPVRPGQEGSPERLILEIWTDGTIPPWEAFTQGAAILVDHFASFRDLQVPTAEEAKVGGALAIQPDQYNTPLEELNLSTRPYNSLKRAGISTLGQLLERSKGGLPPLPGLGAKSRSDVEEVLANLGFPLTSNSSRRRDETQSSGTEVK